MLKKAISNACTKPATAMYPQVKPKIRPNFRGQPVLDIDHCIGCGLCSRECPSKAIEMVMVDGKKRPQFNLAKCIFCYQCAATCTRKAIKNSAIYELATTDKSTLIIKPRPMIPA